MSELAFERVINFRDYGGYPSDEGGTVRRGVLYRSAHFGEATDGDVERLRALGVRLVIDFRGPHDKEQEGHNRLPGGVDELLLPMFDPSRKNDPRVLLYSAPPHEVAAAYPPGRAYEAMLLGSTSFVMSPERIAQYGDMLRAIMAAGGPTVIHCSAGKDRTGWGAALVQLVLRVPRPHVVDDYLLSNNHRRRERESRLAELAAAGVDPACIEPFFGVLPEYIQRMFDTVDEQYGGIDGYVHDAMGISEGDVKRFRAAMLER